MELILAATGILTPILLAAAAAIAAGAVVGGFIGATNGFWHRLSRKAVEGSALRDSYFGAVSGIAVWLFDQCIVYASSV